MVVAMPVRYRRMDPLSKQPLEEFLSNVAAATPAPGGGSSTAVSAALAAALVEMAAGVPSSRASGSSQAGGAVERASALRARALRLAEEEMSSYAPVLEARDEHERELALAAASEPPARVADTAAEVAELGLEVAAFASPSVRGDALAGVVLAEAAASAAFRLVEINVGRGPVFERARQAELRAAAARATGTSRPPPPPHAPTPR
jgi:methenyltetrahydrofolate cyclohydrolase